MANRLQSVKALHEAGSAAFAADQPTSACPYPIGTTEANSWLHGWWKAFYQQRNEDAQVIADYCDWELTDIFDSRAMCEAFAHLVTHYGDYNRHAPITGNRIAGRSFDIPAPASLKRVNNA